MSNSCKVCLKELSFAIPAKSMLFCPHCKSLLKKDDESLEVVTVDEVMAMSPADRNAIRTTREMVKALLFAEAYSMSPARLLELFASSSTKVQSPINFAEVERRQGFKPGPRLERPEVLTAKEAMRALLDSRKQDAKG